MKMLSITNKSISVSLSLFPVLGELSSFIQTNTNANRRSPQCGGNVFYYVHIVST